MNKPKVAVVGWRGMVGTVLMQRMLAENDFNHIDATFLSTSQTGQDGPEINGKSAPLRDANDINLLKNFGIILTTQGSEYTKMTHPRLRGLGWNGFWIDAASELRYADASVLALDPVNRSLIEQSISEGKKDLIGANCTTATMVLGLAGLFKAGLVETANSATYQAVSGAGAKKIAETLQQMSSAPYDSSDSSIQMLEKIGEYLSGNQIIKSEFGAPIAGNAIPLIDKLLESGQSREEWKVQAESRKILGQKNLIVDGTCVRIPSIRSHAQAVHLKLNQDLPLQRIKDLISENEWVKLVADDEDDIKNQLTPVATSGSLRIAVGRLRKLNNGPKHINAYIVGDQLLWGAAEPLRRALRMIVDKSF